MGSRKEIKIPAPSAELAEFLGIFFGDGGIGSGYQVSISFNHKTEQEYAIHIARLAATLFGLSSMMRIRPEHGCGDVIINSRSLVEFLHFQGIKSGDKIREGSHFPDWVFESDETRRASVRGLFDTDGCIYFHSYKIGATTYRYPKLAFTGYSPVIRRQFFDLLVLLGFHPREYGMRVHLYSQDETLKYYREVGTRNSWHRARFEEFCEDRELEQLICS